MADLPKELQGPWGWRTTTGARILLAEHGKRAVVLCGDRGGIMSRGAGGLLRPLDIDGPVASLIASSPDLLSALRGIDAALEDVGWPVKINAQREAVRAAISRAEGK